MDRKDVSSWLSGPKETLEQQGIDFGYPGQRLGFPEAGVGSLSRPGRRLVALTIDWFAALVIAGAVSSGMSANAQSWLVLEIFFIEILVLTVFIGASFGQQIMGIGVRSLGGGRLNVLGVILRTLLLIIVIPAVIYDRDGRGLHDKAVGSVVQRFR